MRELFQSQLSGKALQKMPHAEGVRVIESIRDAALLRLTGRLSLPLSRSAHSQTCSPPALGSFYSHLWNPRSSREGGDRCTGCPPTHTRTQTPTGEAALQGRGSSAPRSNSPPPPTTQTQRGLLPKMRPPRPNRLPPQPAEASGFVDLG